MDDYRKQLIKDNPHRCSRLFDVDPFKTLIADRKSKEQSEKEKEIRVQQDAKVKKAPILITSTSNVPQKIKKEPKSTSFKTSFPKKVWATTTFIDLEESSRELIEKSLKSHIDWESKLFTEESNPEREVFRSKLLGFGFRVAHVNEAMKYKDPLSFLIFNLPEDDLPSYFHKRQEDSKMKIEIASLPLAKRNMIERLSEIGISNDEAQLALEDCNYDEPQACLKLLSDIYPINLNDMDITEAEANDIWFQELESLQSIYETRIDIINESCYSVGLIEKLKIKVKIYKTKRYPQSLPGIVISTFDKNMKLPNYIKISALQKLLSYIEKSQLIGDMFVYNIIDWLEQNLPSIIENPGPLLTQEQIVYNHMANAREDRGKKKRTSIQAKLSEKDASELKREYQSRIKTNEYKNMIEQRSSLPAWKKQDVIVDLIESNDVVLITGETGSGKSTQVVQFLLDHLMKNDNFSSTRIICTQPRRISAIGLAERVSEERCTNCGEEVGYIIRGVNATKPKTRITFMTTGILVRILQGDIQFLKNAIIVIDEVHERSIDTDLIIILLKNIKKKLQGLKIVLMSATVNVDVFKSFFIGLKSVHIEGRTFPIKDYFLDDILDAVDFKLVRDKRSYEDFEVAGDSKYLRPKADSKFFASGLINYELISETVFHVDSQLEMDNNDGSIIIFLPGVGEVNRCCNTLTKSDTGNKLQILPLHSALTPNDQKRVFRRYKGKRKIVVSTNIAETSITIDDCVATIDTGRVKTLQYDAFSNTSKLIENFVSKAEAKQRRGRAGRVRDGYSYKLFSKEKYKDMADLPTPEIKRVTLESLYLSVRSMGIRNVAKFLKEGLDPPPLSSLQKAEQMLLTTGLIDEDKSLTELGKFVSLLPVMDSKHGKLLIYSILFGCTDIGILIASVLSSGSMPFVNEYENRVAIRSILSEFDKLGDVLGVAQLVNRYIRLEGAEKRNFLKANYLSYNKLNEIISSRSQFYSNLKDIGFLPFNYKPGSSSYLNRNASNFEILKCVLTGSFYPNVARVQQPESKFVATSSGSIEKDPEAKLTKYWIRNEEYIAKLYSDEGNANEELPASRAFLHPSSMLFSGNDSSSSNAQGLSSTNDTSSKKSLSTSTTKYSFIIFNSTQNTNKLALFKKYHAVIYNRSSLVWRIICL